MVAPISYEVNATALSELATALRGVEKRIAIRLAVAINTTGKKSSKVASDSLKAVLPVPVRILKKTVGMKSKATHSRTRARLNIWAGYPISLKHFGATDTKKHGVRYYATKADKKSKARTQAPHAFIIRKGGKVYRRTSSERGPLVEVFGPSPGDAMAVTGVKQKVYVFIQKQLPIEIREQVRQVMLANSGIIKFKRG